MRKAPPPMPISPEMIPMAKPRAMAPKVGRVMGGFSVAVPGVVRQTNAFAQTAFAVAGVVCGDILDG